MRMIESNKTILCGQCGRSVGKPNWGLKIGIGVMEEVFYFDTRACARKWKKENSHPPYQFIRILSGKIKV